RAPTLAGALSLLTYPLPSIRAISKPEPQVTNTRLKNHSTEQRSVTANWYCKGGNTRRSDNSELDHGPRRFRASDHSASPSDQDQSIQKECWRRPALP